MDVLRSGSRLEEQVPLEGSQVPVDGVALFYVDSRIGFDKVKVGAKPPSAGTSRISANHVALRVGWNVWVKCTPCRDKSFRKAVSTVTDDLVRKCHNRAHSPHY